MAILLINFIGNYIWDPSGDVCLTVQTVSERFVKFSEADIKSFSQKQENANTKKRTSNNFKLFKELLASEEEMRKLKKFLPPSCKNL